MGSAIQRHVAVYVFGVQFPQGGFPEQVILQLQTGGIGGDGAEAEAILDCEGVNILNGDGDDDGVHGVVNFEFVFGKVLEHIGDMDVQKALDVILNKWRCTLKR